MVGKWGQIGGQIRAEGRQMGRQLGTEMGVIGVLLVLSSLLLVLPSLLLQELDLFIDMHMSTAAHASPSMRPFIIKRVVKLKNCSYHFHLSGTNTTMPIPFRSLIFSLTCTCQRRRMHPPPCVLSSSTSAATRTSTCHWRERCAAGTKSY
jgi:hypothetical protein